MSKELHEYTTDELRVALARAEERAEEQERKERAERWLTLKCRCGKPITMMCEPRVDYVFRPVREDSFGRPHRGSPGKEETTDIAPGEGGLEAGELAWGSCDNEDCQTSEWATINPYDVGW